MPFPPVLPPPPPAPFLELAEFDILIDGLSLSESEKFQVINITVDDTVDLPSMFSIEFANLPGFTGKEFIDNSKFDVGGAVEIRLRGRKQLIPVFQGEITSLEPEFAFDRPTRLIVRGYDRRHRLQRGRKTRVFTRLRDSEIARRIAEAAGLGYMRGDTGVIHEYVLQANQTDMEFLQERAALIHYEVIIRDKMLFFQPVGSAKSEQLTLSFRENNLLEFYPRLSAKEQINAVTVQGWDAQRKEPIISTATSLNAISKMGGKQTGAEVSGRFGNAIEVISDRPIESISEAKQIAIAQLNRSLLKFISGDGICRGQPELLAGKVIRIAEVSDRFSGQYYVVSASHRYKQSGYYTHFTVRRNAS